MERSVRNTTEQLDKTLIEIKSLDNMYPRISRTVPEEIVKKKRARRERSADDFVTKRNTAESKVFTENILGTLASIQDDSYISHKDIGEILWDEFGESVNWDKARIYSQISARLMTMCKHGHVEKKQIRNKQNQTSYVFRLVESK